MTTITDEIDELIRDAINNGQTTITETDTYRQHLLREHPNVCRQALRYTDIYEIHEEPCECGPSEHGGDANHRGVERGLCCWIEQPVGSHCMYCDETVLSHTATRGV